MPARLRMEGDVARACLGKVRDNAVHRLHHQVHIDRRLDAMVAQRIANHWPNGEIGDKVVVHHIEMHDVGASIQDSLDVLAKASEISGENRRSN